MSYAPELYAAVHRGHAGDVQFYLQLAQGRRSVLELGAGYGRIGATLTEAGVRYLGLELSPDLIRYGRGLASKRGRAAGLRLLEGDMSRFELSQRFDCIIIPFTGFYCLTSLADQVACLERVYAHLLPGGVFAFDAYCADAMHDEAADDGEGEPSEPEFVVTVDIQGTVYDVFESSVWDRSAQTIEARYFYDARDGSSFHRGAIPQRYLRSQEVEPLLRAAGFREICVRGGFRGEPFDPEGELLVVQACR